MCSEVEGNEAQIAVLWLSMLN